MGRATRTADDGYRSVAARTIVKDLEMTISNRIPVLTPQGHLMLAPTDEVRRDRGAHAEFVALGSTASAQGPGEHRRSGAVGARQGCAARFSGGADARRG